MKKKFLFSNLSILFLVGAFLVSAPAVSFGQGSNTNILPGFNTNASPGENTNTYSTTLTNPLAFNSICGLVKALFNVILAIGTPIAVLFLVYAGFKFIIARGSEEGLRSAKTNLVHVLAGIAIFLGAWVLGQIIATTINSLAVATGQPSVTGNTCN